MSLIPEFELGLWNAWIFILPMIIISIFGSRILGKRGSEEVSGLTKRMKTATSLYPLLLVLLYAYSVFLPLKLNTGCFYAGLFIYLLGMLFVILSLLGFRTTPADKLVTKGVYHISRNPGYVGDFLVNISIGIACLSWVFLLAGAAFFLLLRYYVVAVEEPFLMEKYGDTYKEYMNRTPRWIGIPKSKKEQNPRGGNYVSYARI
jgi:protein-S-isoprenylcysteine O-methyltransferase Ste14